MYVKLEEMAEIFIGTILTRVNTDDQDVGISVDTICMQEVSNYTCKSDYNFEKLFSVIKTDKIDSCEFTKLGDVIFGITSRNAMVIESCRENKLVTSNFLIIRIKNKKVLNPMYLCWLINEDSKIKSYLRAATQSNSVVSVIRASDLRGMPIDIIPIEQQEKIALFYKSVLEKYKIENKLNKLKFILHKKNINKYYTRRDINENK